MEQLKALYVDWHAPRKIRGNISLCKKPWEIAMIVRATHFAKKYNSFSPILYCDQETFKYYQTIGLDKCFDEIRPVLPMEVDFDPSIFWAAGKFLAIQHIEDNFIMMDLDLEVRFKLDLGECEVFCSHQEFISKGDLVYYPSAEYLDTQNFLKNNYGIDWDMLAYNTSILHFKELHIAKEYANSALSFIRSFREMNPAFISSYILLVEQRFLFDFCKAKNLLVKTLITGNYIVKEEISTTDSGFENSNVKEIGKMGFLHIWGFKTIEENKEQREMSLYQTLLLSRPNLTELIDDCVYINNQIQEKEKSIFG